MIEGGDLAPAAEGNTAPTLPAACQLDPSLRDGVNVKILFACPKCSLIRPRLLVATAMRSDPPYSTDITVLIASFLH